MNTQLTFHETTFHPVTRNGQPWLTAADISQALGYQREDAISRVYQRNADEFTPAMSQTVKLTVKGFGNGNCKKEVRVFSLRGCHLLAMFARTPVAKEFRRWVLDILDKETGNQPALALTASEANNLFTLLNQVKAFAPAIKQAEVVLRAAQSPLAAQVHDAWAEPLLSCSLLSHMLRRHKSTAISRI